LRGVFCVAEAGFELSILLPQSPEYQDYGCIRMYATTPNKLGAEIIEIVSEIWRLKSKIKALEGLGPSGL
jgi:hypothetical protein